MFVFGVSFYLKMKPLSHLLFYVPVLDGSYIVVTNKVKLCINCKLICLNNNDERERERKERKKQLSGRSSASGASSINGRLKAKTYETT